MKPSAFGILITATALLVACAGATRPAAPAAGEPAPARGSAASAAPGAASDALAAALTMPLDELYEKAKAEGAPLAFYGALAQINAEVILPAFEQRFPGIKVDHVDATCDALAARIVAEGRGGRTLADIFDCPADYVQQLNQQGVFFQRVPPEADAYPEGLRGQYWIAADVIYIVAAWNTNLVKTDEVPSQFEDFADPKWKNRLIAEPRDAELLMGLAARKYHSDEQATDLIKRIAANDVEFHKGHSDLAELLVAGQAAACLTCYSHHYPGRIKKGAPVDYMLTEGIGIVNGTAILKDAPHPYTAMLWQRWAHSPEGQQAYADGGRTPGLPSVPPRDKTRPDTVYALTPEDMAGAAKYQRIWKEAFQIR
ncbi:MAG TPA: extracellular solute-binding protein [Chloroflexota bacterium]|nr:extracellular solute-binding protein [Chloroflexota bacterium]